MIIERLFSAVLALGLAWGTGPAAQELQFFRIGTAGTAGTYYPVGGLIADAISAPPGSKPCDQGGSCGVPGLIAAAVSSSGSVANVQAIQSGALESAFVQGDVAAWAYRSTGIWREGAATKLRAIANLYPETMHLIALADAGIGAIQDLRGKRVSLDEQGSGTLVDAELILGAAGLRIADIRPHYLSVGAAAQAMQQGQIDAFFFVGGYPAGAIAELASQIRIEVVPIGDALTKKLVAAYPFLSGDMLPAGTYEGQDQAVATISVGAQWLTSADQPETLIHDITAALWSDSTRDQLAKGPRRARTISRDKALEGLSVPLHPGSERFYRENNMLN